MIDQEPFFATMKLVTGEEILAEVMANDETGAEFFVVGNPIVINETNSVDAKNGVIVSALVPKKWMMYADDELTIVYKNHVVSISELDRFGADFYKKALIAAKISNPIKKKVETNKSTGFIGKIDSFRKKLDGIYDDSPDLKSDS